MALRSKRVRDIARVALGAFVALFFCTISEARTVRVTSSTDAHQDGLITLREAIAGATAGDTIVFDVSQVQLTAGELQISSDLNIDGGAALVSIERKSQDNNVPKFRIFDLLSGNVVLTNLRISGGACNSATADEPSRGAGIYNNGKLVLNHCTIQFTTAVGAAGRATIKTGAGGISQGGGLYNQGSAELNGCTLGGEADGGAAAQVPGASGGAAQGGAIFNDGFMKIDKCLVQGVARGGEGASQTVAATPAGKGGAAFGGGFYNNGTAVVTNTAFVGALSMGGYGGAPAVAGTGGTSGDGYGGAIANVSDLRLVNATIYGNKALSFASVGIGTIGATEGPAGDVQGGGLFQGAAGMTRTINSVFAGNSLVASNRGSGPNVDVSGGVGSEGHNLVGVVGQTSGWTGSDQLGTQANPIDPHYTNDLVDVGGPTRAVLPQFGSPLIDQGDDSVLQSASVATDQRLLPRKIASHVDIGATEFDPPQVGDLIVNTKTDHSDGTCGVVDCTLRDAILAVDADGSRSNFNITFTPSLTGILTLDYGWLGISHPVTIIGPGAAKLQIRPQHGCPVFRVFAGATRGTEAVLINGLGLSGTDVDGANGSGAVENGANLILTDCLLADNKSAIGGGAIHNLASQTQARLTMLRCTLRNNSSAGSGGAILNNAYSPGSALLQMTNCTIADNSAAVYAGAIYNTGTGGGEADVTLTNCTVVGNTAVGEVSGIYDNTTGWNGAGIAKLQLSNTLLGAPPGSGALLFDHQNGITSLGSNISSDAAGGDNRLGRGGFLNAAGDQRNTDPKLDRSGLRDNGGSTPTIALRAESPAVNAGNDSNAPATDQRGFGRIGQSDIGAYELQSPSASPTPVATASPSPTAIPTPPARSQNIATRLKVLAGDNVMIGGFIVTGSTPKKVLVRGIGPSVPVSGALQDPTLELHFPDGTIVTNDNWKVNDATGQSQQADVTATGVAPQNNLESAIVATLSPGSYTAILRGRDNGTGVALVEVYDVDSQGSAELANISTRGFVDTGDNVMIGGFIVGPKDAGNSKVAIRAIGPSLPVSGTLQDPMLELHDGNGTVTATNDNWQTDPSAAEIQFDRLNPGDSRESALIRLVSPGAYTVIVKGVDDSIGVGLVEVYNLR